MIRSHHSEDHNSLQDSPEDNNCLMDNDPCQLIAQNLQSLKQCKQTLTQLMHKMGGNKDSATVRSDISTIRGKALNLSRHIHSELTELRNQQQRDKSKRNISANRSRMMRKELEEEYGTILPQLQSVFDDIKSNELKFPIQKLFNHNSNNNSNNKNGQSSTTSIGLRKYANDTDEMLSMLLDKNRDGQFVEITDQDLDLEEEREKEENERDLDSLLQVFENLHDSVLVQEEKIQVVAENIEKAATDVHQGTKFQQRAARFAAIAGATIVGGLIGAAVGGPVGLVVGANIAVGTGLAVGAGVGVGMSVGAAAGFGGKKIADKVNGAHRKLKRTAEDTASSSETQADNSTKTTTLTESISKSTSQESLNAQQEQL